MSDHTLAELRKMEPDALEALRDDLQQQISSATEEKGRIGSVLEEKRRQERAEELRLRQQAIQIEIDELEG